MEYFILGMLPRDLDVPSSVATIHGTMRSLSPPVACGIVNDITDCQKQLDGEKPDDAQNSQRIRPRAQLQRREADGQYLLFLGVFLSKTDGLSCREVGVRNALLDNDERGGLIGEGMNQDRCIQCGELSASPLIWASPGSSFPVRHRAIRGRSLAWRHLTQSAGGLGGNKKLLASWTEHNVSPGH